MDNIRILLYKFKNLKIDIPAMINSTVLFIIAWELVFWVFQFFTILPAFSLGVKMIIYNSFIDFNSVNTAASDEEIWASADNINNVFLTPVIFSIILALTSLLFLTKWNSDRLHMRRFLFWIIICIVIRINCNFIFGHLFNLWNWNLVTDFMGLTYPNTLMKYACIAISLIITITCFILMSNEIKQLFNPFINDRFNNLNSNVFIPVLLGSVILIFWNMPALPKSEIGTIIVTLIMTVFFLCMPFSTKYRGMEQRRKDYDEKERVNLIPILILALMLIFNIILTRGAYLVTSAYRNFFVENIIMIFVIVTIVLTLVLCIAIYRRRANAKKKEWQQK